MRAALGLGANLGDRYAALDRALELIRADPVVLAAMRSPLYETDPVGGPEQPDFLNAVVVADLPDDADPADLARNLLFLARSIEADLQRIRGQRWGPRTIDVDVLALGGYVSQDPELTVPHPRLAERAFVLVPWARVDPGFPVPGLATVAELAAALPDSELAGVRPVSDYPG